MKTDTVQPTAARIARFCRRKGVEEVAVALLVGIVVLGVFFTRPSIAESLDYIQFYLPNFVYLADAIGSGTMPLWNPYIGLGRPYLGDLQTSCFYPPLYLTLLGETTGLFLLLWFHSLLAVFGMRFLGARLEIGKLQSYLVGILFILSGGVAGRYFAGQVFYCSAVSYLPALFYMATRLEEERYMRNIAIYSVLLAGQFLCSAPQVFWFSTLGQGTFVLFRGIRRPISESLRACSISLARFVLVLVWTTGLAAVALLPFLEVVKQGNRSLVSREFADYGALYAVQFFGLFTHPPYDRQIGWEHNLFVGFAILIPGVAGLLRIGNREMRGLSAVAVLGLLISLGDATPAFELFYNWVPGFAGFRLHARAGLLISFALFLGFAWWLSQKEFRVQNSMGLFGAAAVLIIAVATAYPYVTSSGVTFSLWSRVTMIAAVTTLACLAAHLLSKRDPRFLAVSGALCLIACVEILNCDWVIKKHYSFGVQTGQPASFPMASNIIGLLSERGLMDRGKSPPRVSIPPHLITRNHAMVYRYSNYDAYTSLFLKRPWDYLHVMAGLKENELDNTFLPPEVYNQGAFPYQDLGLVFGVDEQRQRFLFRTNSPERAFLVHAAEHVPQYEQVLDRLKGGWDGHKVALVEQPVPLGSKEPGEVGSVSVREFQPNAIMLDLDVKQPSLLVLAEAWYPGWKIEINGAVSGALPANGWMRAFVVPAGKYQARVYYRQNYLLAGGIISLLSVAVLVWVLFRNRAGRKDLSAVPASGA